VRGAGYTNAWVVAATVGITAPEDLYKQVKPVLPTEGEKGDSTSQDDDNGSNGPR
jgi:hypothetical protein